MMNLWLQVSRPDNIPILILLAAVTGYTWWSVRKGLRNDRQGFVSEARLSDKIQVWPYLVRVEFIATIFILLLLVVWSILIDAPLEDPANPAITPNPTKAPWYFVGLQEMLVYFDPWIAGVLIPTLIILGLILIPYIDPNRDGSGFYTIRRRWKAMIIFGTGFIGLWIVLIVIGTFWRGPGWNLVAPWEAWDLHQVSAMTNVDLTERFFGIPTYFANHRLNPLASITGGAVVILYYSLIALYWFLRKNTPSMKSLGLLRYTVISFFLLSMLSLPLKMALRIVFDVKYVWVTPWFNV